MGSHRRIAVLTRLLFRSDARFFYLGILFTVMSRLIPFLIVLFVVLGCGGSMAEKPPPEVQARIDYVRQLNDAEPAATHVSYATRGPNMDILEINILQNIPRYDGSEAGRSFATSEIRKKARALGFVEIRAKGGSRTLTEPDTIDVRIPLTSN
jgi:hypothetical protein